MKRKTYVKPEAQIMPLYTENGVLEIGGSTGTTYTFGKGTKFEEDLNGGDWDEHFGNPFMGVTKPRSVWEDFDDNTHRNRAWKGRRL